MHSSMMGKLPQFYFYFLGYLMLLEWLRPLKVISDVGYLPIFIVFSIIPFVAYLFSVKLMPKMIILAGFILISIYYIYFSGTILFNPTWLLQLATDIMASCRSLFTGDFDAITNDFKTLLFFILLWIMTYLIHYWIFVQRSIFLFFFISILFVATLDSFTLYDGDRAILRLFMFGLLMIGSLALYRKSEQGKLQVDKKLMGLWFLPLVGTIVFACAIGLAAPKSGALWPDPVPFLKSYSDKFTENETHVSKVGYGVDDRRLGGGFEKDDTVVFKATVGTKHYWRVESKDFYTGKGWIKSPGEKAEKASFRKLIPISESDGSYYNKKVSTDSYKDKVSIKLLYDHVPYPNPAGYVTIDESDDPIDYQYDPISTKVISVSGEKKKALEQYGLTYTVPIYNVDELKKADRYIEEWEKSNGRFPDGETYYNVLKNYSGVKDDDLQLPKNLPDRVKYLAKEITAGRTTRYDKVKAVEQYFDRPEFVYDRKDIPYPKDGQDFVDQFLFETQRGYCDHFSTSMIVLLRSLGIESRWVKGYTPGELAKNEGGLSTYEITNNNAHSWVEVYFPFFGWVPFEPTKGFSNDARFVYNESRMNKPKDEKTDTPASNRPATKVQPRKTVQKELAAEPKDAAAKKEVNKEETSLAKPILLGVVVILLFVLVYALRRKWMPRLWILVFRYTSKTDPFESAYKVLLKELKRYGITREQGQTLREYARYVDQYFSGTEMGRLTEQYEKYIYSGKQQEADWQELFVLWRKVMEKTIT
ncbi:DUF4129 domain-containing transglutaminase family protein [Bacillus testis]|uniref:DUF4129 domain-containing transglutaminase family protein n=1 Tax=Bacillus testis TaxID=1622072 RepID=UPI00067E9690|nr:transglutaminase domain-containing protein [Bacillus testis]